MLDFHRFETRVLLALVLLGVVCALPAFAQPRPALHPKYSVQFFPLRVDNQDLRMAYRDVLPTGAANGKTVLLFHGKNFSGFYWEPTIEFLAQQGFRVIAPDQLGSAPRRVRTSITAFTRWRRIRRRCSIIWASSRST